jgi:hypothetical protein
MHKTVDGIRWSLGARWRWAFMSEFFISGLHPASQEKKKKKEARCEASSLGERRERQKRYFVVEARQTGNNGIAVF